MNETLRTAIVLIVVLLGTFGLLNFFDNEKGLEKVTHEPIPSISADEDYGKDFKTYKSKLGYSFQYPDYMFITEDPEPNIPERILVLSSTINKDDMFGVVISVMENSEGEDPEHWIKVSYSGEDLSKDYDYNVFDIDGQKAISTDGGTWVVVNTPNNKYRLSVALLYGKGNVPLFTEIGIIVSSLIFAH